MRFGIWRGVTLACALTAALAVLAAGSARADWFHHTIPKETPALDYRTGDVMRAPPIPYGEYAKDYAGSVHGAVGMAAGLVHGLCAKCGGALCGLCGGLGHRGGHGCGGCGGDGCGHCGSGLLGGLFGGHGHKHGLGHGHGGGGLFHGGGLHGAGLKSGHGGALCGPGMPCASGQSGPAGPVASAQGVAMPSSQTVACGGCEGLGKIGGGPCGLCGGRGLLAGLANALCGLCGGKGCGTCGGDGLADSNACGSCGGKGCGLCGGTGLIHKLTGLPHHLMGGVHSAVGMVLHRGDIDYFVGPGGPVPLTPGYVPYIVPTRSPRDYFAFPPFTEQVAP